MGWILVCLSGVFALSFYAPEELASRCRKFGIPEEDCRGSVYINNAEYDSFLKSFNLPIQKDPGCEKKRCFVSVFRDPPRVFVKSAGDMKCMPSYMCSPESYQGSQGAPYMNAQPPGEHVLRNVISATTTVYQPIPYPVPSPDTDTRSRSSARQRTSTESGQCVQPAAPSSSAADHTSSASAQTGDVVTLIRPVYSTVTIDNPITLYREITTTVLHEVPLTNYKVTTVTEEVSTTRTVERTVAATETCTKTISVTESVSRTIVSTHEATSVSTEYIAAASRGAPPPSTEGVVPQERPAAATGPSTAAATSGTAMPPAGGPGCVLSISVKTVTETLLGAPAAPKTAVPAPAPPSVSVSTVLLESAPAEQRKVDVPQLLRPIIEQLSMCWDGGSESSRGVCDTTQKTVYKTTTLPVTETETETRTVRKVRTVTRAGAGARKGWGKSQQTVYNTVYAYKRRRENPPKKLCVPKECLDDKEAVSTVFVPSMYLPSSVSFTTYSSDEILAMSCVEVALPASFDPHGHPLPNGLYDERMGPLKMDGVCRTCKLGYFECPGHFGHIVLPEIAISPMHFDLVYKKAATTCERCFAKVEKKCKRCSFRMPSFSKSRGKIFRDGRLVRPSQVFDTLQRAGLGLDRYFLRVVPVVPNRLRPTNHCNGRVFEDSQNILLARIIKCAMAVRGNAGAPGAADARVSSLHSCSTDEPDKGSSSNQEEVSAGTAVGGGAGGAEERGNKDLEDLISSVNEYYDSSSISFQKGNTPNGIKQLLERKEGLFRKYIMGKRVNYAARSVISPDPNLSTREIGLPLVFAKKLTFPERVTPFNHDRLKHAVINGPTYPGAVLVKSDGVATNLLRVSEEKRVALANQLLNGRKTVYRHLNETDFLLVNRQPTLHKPSIMAYKVRILQGEKTLRLHYANCNSHNADFDGDEMNVHAMQCYISKSEARYLALNDYNYKVATNGSPIRGLVQDHVVMSAVLTMKDYFLRHGECSNMLQIPLLAGGVLRRGGGAVQGGAGHRRIQMPRPAIGRPVVLYTGKQVVTALLHTLGLPISMSKASRLKLRGHPEEGVVEIREGVMLTGVLDKNNLGPTERSLVHQCGEVFGEEVYNDLLTAVSQVMNKMLVMDGYTLRMEDLLLSEDGEAERRAAISEGRSHINSAICRYMEEAGAGSGGDPRHLSESWVSGLDAVVRSSVCRVANRITAVCTQGGMLRSFPYNNLILIVQTGAKGSLVNASQISAMLGQQELEGKRVPLMVDGRTLPVLSETTAESGGLIFERFLDGISICPYYFHCMAGREGLVDTAVKTSRSGYLQRCLVKHLEGVKVEYDGTVRNNGSVVSFRYGEDGLDPTKVGMLGDEEFLRRNCVGLARKYAEERSDAALVPMLEARGRGAQAGLLHAELETLGRWRRELAEAQPGDPVGIVAGQSLGEPSTQMTLNTFHHAGVGAKNMTLGIPRLVEILMVASKNIKTPYLSVPAERDVSGDFKTVGLSDCLSRLLVRESWVIRDAERCKRLSIVFEIKREAELVRSCVDERFVYMLNKKIKKVHKETPLAAEPECAERSARAAFEDEESCSAENSEEDAAEDAVGSSDATAASVAEPSPKRTRRAAMDAECRWVDGALHLDVLLHRGIDVILYPLIEKTISEMIVRKTKGVRSASWAGGVLTLEGANMEILGQLAQLEIYRAYSNDIHSVCCSLGVEAARGVIIREISSVFDAYGIGVQDNMVDSVLSKCLKKAPRILALHRQRRAVCTVDGQVFSEALDCCRVEVIAVHKTPLLECGHHKRPHSAERVDNNVPTA
ncbi:UNVERIFIED_CONTAM: hypothetical protein PYX00_011373 [Menopon gallinae]|uniref:DNA-directed RNA polymerase subunit n=1 Tax=Menopon gallinae TaxID=328185 RepID=A0AAW2H7A1_9NEOP